MERKVERMAPMYFKKYYNHTYGRVKKKRKKEQSGNLWTQNLIIKPSVLGGVENEVEWRERTANKLWTSFSSFMIWRGMSETIQKKLNVLYIYF